MRTTLLGFYLRVIENEKPLNLEKTTPSVLYVFLSIYGLVNQANSEIPSGAVLNQTVNSSPRLRTLAPIQLPPMNPQFHPPIGITAFGNFFTQVQIDFLLTGTPYRYR